MAYRAKVYDYTFIAETYDEVVAMVMDWEEHMPSCEWVDFVEVVGID